MQQPQIQQQQHRAPTGDSWNRGPMNSQQPLQQHAQQHEHMQQQKDQQDQHIQQQQQQQHQHMQQQQYLLMQQQQQQQNLLQQQQQRQPHNHHPQQLILATPQSLVRQPGVDTIRELSTLQGKHCFGEIGGSSGPGAHFMQGGGLEQGSQEKGGMMGMMGEKGGMMRRMEQGDIMGNAEEVGVMGMMGSFGMPHASQMENMGGVDVLRNVFQGFPGFGGPPQELIQKMQRDNQEAFGMAMLRGMPPGMQMSGLNQVASLSCSHF